jgi:hypothetical protein
MKMTNDDAAKILMLTERMQSVIDELASISSKSMAWHVSALNDRVTKIRNSLIIENDEFETPLLVENVSNSLEDIDDDTSIMDIPLNLKEACKLNFDKHIDALLDEEDNAIVESVKREKSLDKGNGSEFNKRYLERSNNVIRFKK